MCGVFGGLFFAEFEPVIDGALGEAGDLTGGLEVVPGCDRFENFLDGGGIGEQGWASCQRGLIDISDALGLELEARHRWWLCLTT